MQKSNKKKIQKIIRHFADKNREEDPNTKRIESMGSFINDVQYLGREGV